MAETTKKPRKRRRRRRRSKKPRGDGDEKKPRDGQEARKARESGPTPWSQQREEADRARRKAEEARKREAEEKDVDPRKVYSDRPVFLASHEDLEEQFVEDLVEPEWNLDGEWKRTAYALIPITRNRLIADAGDLHFVPGDQVILSTGRGIELGFALEAPVYRERRDEIKNRILRCFGYSDSRQMSRNETKSVEALELCRKLIEERKLAMKLLRVEHLHGGGKAVFYFTAEKRVDFRQLIRDLAGQLHTRIEMRQVGVRDAARLVGGQGPCGQRVCCNRFLSKFSPVSIKMAKVQSLMLNPHKVSGICGRLLCCLEYEYEQYREIARDAPRVGREVRTSEGPARVRDVMLIEGKCALEMGDGSRKICPWHEIEFTREPQESQGGERKRGRRRGRRKKKSQEKKDE
jgi:cell fate regulator YaaT (PSP1 superfamily)